MLGPLQRQITPLVIVARATALLPSQVSGLGLWLDATALTGLAASDPVATWNDLSGNGHDFTQATSTRRPIYQPTGFNGRACLRFDSTLSQALTNTALASVWSGEDQARTVFAVYRQTDTAGTRSILASQGSTSIPLWILDTSAGQTRFLTRDDASAQRSINLGTPDLLPHVACLHSIGTVGNAWRDGAQVATNVAFDNGVISLVSVGVGSRGSGANYFAGDIAEIVVFHRALSMSEREGVERYLRAKWGV